VLGIQLLLLLAMAQVMYAGYRLGVGNQSIQIPFLKHYVDNGLFANDPMVQETLADYPSFFFKLLAVVVGHYDLNTVYFWLHVLTAAAVFLGAYALGKAIFKDRASGIVLVLLMLAGHHRALAGDDLYSVGFTHTWAVFPLAIWAMVLLYQNRLLAAFALLGIIFNLHALTAGYLLAMFLAWAVFYYRRPGWTWRLSLMLAVFALLAMPTLIDMLNHRQQFGHEWMERTRIRSHEHSFPSTWWATGAIDLPRFVLLLGLAAISLSFPAEKTNQRKSLLMAAGVGFLFLIGWVFSDIWPNATVVRAQLFRSSRLIVVLMLAHLAHSIVSGWRLSNISRLWKPQAPPPPWQGSSDEPAPAGVTPVLEYRSVPVRTDAPLVSAPFVARITELLLATATFICLAIPGLMPFAPWLLLASILVALLNSRLNIAQTIVASLAIMVVLIARRTIDYDIPGIDGTFSMAAAIQNYHEAGRFLLLPLLLAPLIWIVLQVRIGARSKLCISVAVLIACALLAVKGERTMAVTPTANSDPWIQIQRWAAANTPKSALFLTPPQQGGFRIYSDRSVVCEWRDGTQLYFSAEFAKDWWKKLMALRPVAYDKSLHELFHGKSLEKMSDEEIVNLATEYGATHVVLPAGKETELDREFSNDAWSVYKPKVLDSQEKFIKEVATPNIEHYRKSDARLQLTDASGQTLTSGHFEITQTKQAFGFGCSLPFFAEPPGDAGRDNFEPPQVTPKELELFKAVFNYTVIPFSAKWQRLEPEQGEHHYEELDKYVDWCARNGITMEFHYLSGFIPNWARRLPTSERKAAWLRHCRDTVERYHDRIKYWQVDNDSMLNEYVAQAIKEIRSRYPDLKLGISNCSQFYVGPAGSSRRSGGLMLGSEEVKQVQEEGAKLDFFSSHGHKPMGAWPDMRTMYECFDGFQELGVKMHISEATLDLGLRFMSPVRQETEWTPELAAEFYKNYYTTAFSHPAMEAINYWDLSSSINRASASFMSIGGTGRAGLLDPEKNDEPRPLYNMLKKLIRHDWMTNLKGNLSSDGAVAFRGFHGDYEITVTTPSGKKLRGTFTIKPNSNNAVQLKLGENASVAEIK
jgi:GH35 family endo-1,4-beta-xylanase